MNQAEPLVEVRNLVKHFPVTRGIIFKKTIGQVHAVDDITFDIARGETLGLVGETGCGKSTTARLIMRLLEPTSGTIRILGEDITHKKQRHLRALRRKVQIIFQDPFASLDPRMTVGAIIGEPLKIHRLASGREARRRIQELMELVGLNADRHDRYPHEFSGGQRQRVGVARALAVEPDLIVCDEPVSALDVSIQAQILNLLSDLQDELNLTYMFIAHDLSVVRHVCDRIAVMYLGKIAELAPRDELYARPMHPYTQALLSAVPVPDPDKERARQRIVLQGDVPSPLNPPPACRFHTRCWKAQSLCMQEEPLLMARGGAEAYHRSACHYAEESAVV